MHDNLDLIVTLAGGLAAALIFGSIAHLVGLSPIVGYLLAGVAIGPFTPGPVADQKVATELAEIGVILLMFGVGLQFHVEELLAVWRTAVPGALAQSGLSAVLGAGVGKMFGLPWDQALAFGLTLSVASTVVLTRVLEERKELQAPVGHVAVGWLVVQDLFAVFVLVLGPAVFGPNAGGNIPAALGGAALKVGLLIGAVVVLGGRLIPWLFRRAAATRSRELFTLTILTVALGVAVGSAVGFGVSMALGAFLAGMVVGRSEFSVRAASEALPMRDAFAVLFFVSAGMLLDPKAIAESPGLALTATLAVMIGTPLIAFLVTVLLGRPMRLALTLALALGQVGEFSFILAALGRGLGVVTERAAQAVTAAAIVSISLNPLLVRLSGPMAKRLARHGRPVEPDPKPDETGPEPENRAVVVGYGPVGRTLARLLSRHGVEPTVVEMNHDTVERLRAAGGRAVFGDASRRETLEAAGLARAGDLILSASHLPAAEVIRVAREINPRVRVLARSAYLSGLGGLLGSGADAAFADEGEVALAMTERVLQGLGAGADKIGHERGKLRDELIGADDQPAPDQPPVGHSRAEI